MSHPGLLTSCELHVHIGGCFYLDDLLELGREIYPAVDWTLFVESYESAFGHRPDPVALFRDALDDAPGGRQRLREHYVFSPADGGDFERFMARFNLLISLYRHRAGQPGGESDLIQMVVARHRREGLEYVEYRAMSVRGCGDADAFLTFHAANAEALRDASGDGLQARYIVSIPRWEPEAGYRLVRQLQTARPDLLDVIVGVDFCHSEEGYPPRLAREVFRRLEEDNRQRPEASLAVVYHVGEIYFDKSLESAVRWCHEAAELGARRLGHAIALGLDPEVAVSRGVESHLRETVGERRDQIAYDVANAPALRAVGVDIDSDALEREAGELAHRPQEEVLARPYTAARLEQIRRRQGFVLARLCELGTVIETCPTSNMLLGWVPAPEHHPVHRFIESGVRLVIGADDPGIFDSPLADEVAWVCRHTGHSEETLSERLGDPRRHSLDRHLQTRSQRGIGE